VNHLDGALYNGPTWTSEPEHASVLSFDGVDDYVYVPPNLVLNMSDRFEIEAWIKVTGTANYYAIVDKHAGGAPAQGYTLYVSGGRLRLSIYAGPNGNGDVMGTTDLRDSAWHHVLGRWTGQAMQVYVDGRLEGGVSWSYAPVPNSNAACIGRRTDGWGGYMLFRGVIGEVRISHYNNAPVLVRIGPQSAIVGMPKAILLQATDADPSDIGRLTFYTSANDEQGGGMYSIPGEQILTQSPGATSATLSWTPAPPDAGSYQVRMGVQDLYGNDEEIAPVVILPADAVTLPGVPSGRTGSPMTVSKLSPDGNTLGLSWDVATCGSSSHTLVHGGGSQLPPTPGGTYRLAGSACDLGGTGTYTWVNWINPSSDPKNFCWWLILATDGAAAEGSWGT
jgi:hypothetical protein